MQSVPLTIYGVTEISRVYHVRNVGKERTIETSKAKPR